MRRERRLSGRCRVPLRVANAGFRRSNPHEDVRIVVELGRAVLDGVRVKR
jgi:hypothetical protein